MDDIRKAIRFHDIVSKRHRQLNRMLDDPSRAHQSRSMLDYKRSQSTKSVLVNTSGQITYNGTRTDISTEEVWATVRWKPKSHMRNLGSDAIKAYAFRTALGLSRNNIPLVAWKILPWSWLIDWFTNVSEYIQANQNMIDFIPSHGCIMIHRRDTSTIPGGTWSWSGGRVVRLSRTEYVNELKSRYPVSSFSSFSIQKKLPYLDNFKMSVLGSLAILKIGKLT